MKFILRIALTVTGVFTGSLLMAQSPILDSAKAEMYRINKVFDSSAYLGFNVSMVYDTDTLFGKFEHAEVYGNYILNRKNMYSRLEQVEFIQTDSFVYNIDNDSKMLMMTKDAVANSTKFPVREFADSIIAWYDTSYVITMHVQDSTTRVIEFNARFPDLPYTRFAMYYQAISYYPLRFDMAMQGEFDLTEIPDSLLSKVKVKPMLQRMSIIFSDYHPVTDVSVFNDSNYATYDRAKRYYRPNPKYRGYRFLTNGIEGESVEDAPELSSPPPGSGTPF